MDTNNIIDAEYTDNDQPISNRTLAIINITGILSMILGGVSILQIMFGFAEIMRTAMDLGYYQDMGEIRYYILSGIFNKLTNMTLNVFATVFFFRYAIFATRRDKTSFGNMEWETIFRYIRNILIVFGLKNIFWFLFSLVRIFIGLII